ncbi:hypothetical protein J6590_019680 [Homalodisca vitripennis]|nr:hypothetical protein J6590_019680 [Homalodisca vitripennis]
MSGAPTLAGGSAHTHTGVSGEQKNKCEWNINCARYVWCPNTCRRIGTHTHTGVSGEQENKCEWNINCASETPHLGAASAEFPHLGISVDKGL